MGRHVRVECADEVGERDAVPPGDPERIRRPPQPRQRLRVGLRQRPQDADARPQHQLRRGLTGHQRDLRVPALHGEGRTERELVPVGAAVDGLLGDRQVDPVAIGLTLLAEEADFAQEPERLVGRALVEIELNPGVVEARAAADERPADGDAGSLSARVGLHRPDERRSGLAGQQAPAALGDLRRVEARVSIRCIERLPAHVGLPVHRPAGRDERGNVGDRIPHAVARAVALDVHRLIEVHGLGRVERHERDRRLVRLGEPG